MAAPSYTSDLTTITTAESTTGWSALGGGASGLSASPDLAVEGTNCVDKQITNAEKGQVYDNGATITNSTDRHFFVWVIGSTPGLEDTLANRGKAVIIGTGTSAHVAFHVSGSNVSNPGFRTETCFPIRYVTTASTGFRTVTGSPGANPQWFGATLNITASVKGANLGVDVIRYGTGYDITNGDVGGGGPATFGGIATNNDTSRYGVFRTVPGGFNLQGKLRFGSAGTLVYSVDSNRNIVIVDTPHTTTDFTEVIVNNASSTITWTNVNFTAIGTNNRGRFRIIANAAVTLTGCGFSGMSDFTLTSTTTASTCSWRNCGQITSAGATLTDSTVAAYEGTADTSALIWNTATSTSGKLDRMRFTMGTASTHGIEFGTASPTTIDLVGVIFTGYSASNNVNNSMLHIKRTSGTVTINITGGGTTPSYRTDGAIVSIVSNPVTFSVTSQTSAGSAVVTNVLLKASSGTGLPILQATTITNSGTTATATTTGVHGLVTGDKVNIEGASHIQNNGVFTVTVTGTTTFTYTLSTAPGSNPTGTITTTFVFLEGTTNGSGFISASRSLPGSFGMTGWARKGSGAPYYKEGALSGTVLAASGASLTAIMVSDE